MNYVHLMQSAYLELVCQLLASDNFLDFFFVESLILHKGVRETFKTLPVLGQEVNSTLSAIFNKSSDLMLDLLLGLA